MSVIAGGLLLGVLTTALSAGGLAFQRNAHKRLLSRQQPGEPLGRSFSDAHWRVGVAMMVTSALLSLAVTALLGQALSSSLAALTIVWAFFFSVVCLHEKPTRLDAVAAVALVSGTVCVVLGKIGFSPAPAAPLFLSAAEIVGIFAGRRQLAIGLLIGAALVASLIAEFVLKRVDNPRVLRPRALLAVRLFLASACGATTGICSKGFSVIVASAISKSSNVGLDVAAVFFIALLASVVLQMRYLGESLKIASLNAVVPLYQSALVVGGAICGLAIWNEPLGVMALFFAGIACIVTGILLKLRRSTDAEPATTPPRTLAPSATTEQPAPPRRRNSAPAMLEVSARSKALQDVRTSMPFSVSEADVGGRAATVASPLASSDAVSFGLAF